MTVSHMQHEFDHSAVAAKDYGNVLGTPFKVFLANGVNEYVNASGKSIVDFVDLPGLVATIVQGRVLHPQKLRGADLCYIRSALRMRSANLADVLEISPEHYSRCENDSKSLSDDKEKFYRMFAYLASCLRDRTYTDRVSKEELLERAQTCSSPEKAHKAMIAFGKIFLGMKIQPFYTVGEEMCLRYSRQPTTCSCGDDEDWRENEAA